MHTPVKSIVADIRKSNKVPDQTASTYYTNLHCVSQACFQGINELKIKGQVLAECQLIMGCYRYEAFSLWVFYEG